MRMLTYFIGVVAVCIAIVVVMGIRLPKEHRVENSAEITAPPLAVWTAISDVAAGPSWRSDVKRVEVLDQDQRRWREYGKTGSVIYRLDRSEPMHRRVVVIDDPSLPFTGRWEYTLEALPDGNSRIKIVEAGKVWHPVYRFVGHYIMGEQSSINRYLNDLQKSFAYSGGKAAHA